ncbi:MAG: hypothetical protein ACYDEX_06800 [Mobilitalea sp.]
MDKLKKLLKDSSFKNDVINTLLGVALIVSLILIFLKPTNQIAILIACTTGGLINIMNGLKLTKDPKKKTTGMTYFMMGFILIAMGFFIITMV